MRHLALIALLGLPACSDRGRTSSPDAPADSTLQDIAPDVGSPNDAGAESPDARPDVAPFDCCAVAQRYSELLEASLACDPDAKESCNRRLDRCLPPSATLTCVAFVSDDKWAAIEDLRATFQANACYASTQPCKFECPPADVKPTACYEKGTAAGLCDPKTKTCTVILTGP